GTSTNTGSSGTLGAGSTSGSMSASRGALTEDRVRQIIREELQRAGMSGGMQPGVGSPGTVGGSLTNRGSSTPSIIPDRGALGIGTNTSSGPSGIGTGTGRGTGTGTGIGTGTGTGTGSGTPGTSGSSGTGTSGSSGTGTGT